MIRYNKTKKGLSKTPHVRILVTDFSCKENYKRQSTSIESQFIL